MIKFYEHRKIFFTISICLILFGLLTAFINGIQLDIQFAGGSILKYNLFPLSMLNRLKKSLLRRSGKQPTANCNPIQ
jgi:preprotein translocase subunit SecF